MKPTGSAAAALQARAAARPRTERAWRTYSVEVGEHTNTRVLPEALIGALTLDEYQHVLVFAVEQYERTRVTGTRILRFATHFPCIVLCLMPLLLRRLSYLDSQLKQRLQTHCDEATAEHSGRVEFTVRQLGGLTPSRSRKQQRQQLWVDIRFRDLALGHVRGDLYELQAPPQPGELPPPRPHSPPEFSSDDDDDDDDDRRPLTQTFEMH